MIFVHSLGKAQIDVGETQVRPTSRKFSLLLRLSAEPGQRIAREALHELMYPDLPLTRARHSLREMVYELRQTGVRLSSDAEGVELRAEAVRSDVSEVIDGERPKVSLLRAAEGGFMPGYAPAHSEAFAEWFDGYRAKTVFGLARKLLEEVRRAKSVGDWTGTERAARAVLGVDPLNEEATLALAEMLAIGGAKVQAVRLLDTYMAECPSRSSELTVPAKILKRRIGERLPERYQSGLELPFAGRQIEMQTLLDAFDETREGRTQCILLSGEPGIGKSRLSTEFLRFAALQGANTHVARCAPNDQYHPLSVFFSLVPSLTGLRGALGCSQESVEIFRRFSADQGSAHNSAASDDTFFTLARALLDLLDAVSSESALVISVEDIHWIDSSSFQLLATIAANGANNRVMFVLTTRDPVAAIDGFRQVDRFRSIQLRGLDADATRELTEAALKNAPDADSDAHTWIARTSSGNPLFISNLAHHYRTSKGAIAIPADISALIQRRLEPISKTAFGVLQIATLLGKHSTVQRLQALSELPHATFLATLAELNDMGFLEGTDTPSLITPHALIADGVLRRSVTAALLATHAHIASRLENEAPADTNGTLFWDSAEHWLAAGCHELAAKAFRRCAEYVRSIGRPKDAADLLCKAAERIGDAFGRELALEGARIANASSELETLLSATTILRRFGWTPTHDDLEVAELIARLSWFDQSEGVIEHLNACVNSETSDVDHRRAAGFGMLLAADFNIDSELGHRAYAALRPLLCADTPEDQVFAATVNLLYASAFGSIDDAGLYADELARLAAIVPANEAWELQRRAGIGYYFAGRSEDAHLMWEMAYARATAAGLVRARVAVALMLGANAADIGHDEISRKWLTTVDEVANLIPAVRLGIPYLSHSIDCAIKERNLNALRECGHALKQLPPGQSARSKRLLAAVETMIAILSGEPFHARILVDELTRDHGPMTQTGNASDVEIAVCIHACLKAEELELARLTLNRYVTETRRAKSPLWSSLRCAITELNAAEQAAQC